MKIKYDVRPGCEIETEIKDVKQGFALVAYLDEVFGQKKCGNCGSSHIKLQYRTPQGYEYYSVKCEECGHELKFGQAKDTGRLFPKGWEPGYQSDKPQTGGSSEPQYHNNQDEYTPAPPQNGNRAAAASLPF